MTQKTSRSKSRKTVKNPYSPAKPCQKKVTKLGRGGAYRLDESRLKNNLGQMVKRFAVGGKVHAYEQIAAQLSSLAGLTNGHMWSWRYVASVCAGTMEPSRKFMRAVDLLLLNMSPRQRQWFYFANRRRDVAAIYNKSILREMIFMHMKAMGYKPVTYTRYAEIKRRRIA